MDSHPPTRQGTVYIRETIPKTLKDLVKEPNYDLDKILLQQIKVVANCKKRLVQKRTELLKAIEKECLESDNNSCGPFDGEFLSSVLRDVEKDEAEGRRKVLGEQESVEMFKTAFAEDAVSEHHLQAARSYRDSMTRQLVEIVEAREITLIALEVLRRSPVAHVPQNNTELEMFGARYVEAKEDYVKNCEFLKKLTELKRKPELHITQEDELFSFFSDKEPEVIETGQEEGQTDVPDTSEPYEEESNLATALNPWEEETESLVRFKVTKVDVVDKEFKILSELASDILKHAQMMNDAVAYVQKACGCSTPMSTYGIGKFVTYLKAKHSNLKFKVSTKGYNFTLKVIQRTKSVISLSVLTTLLDVNQDLPEEVVQAQKVFSDLSTSVKRILSKYGRCSMAFQSLLNREKQLDAIIQEAPKVDYAESLRISGNFAANMKEVRRVNVLKDEIKETADCILQEVLRAAGEKNIK